MAELFAKTEAARRGINVERVWHERAAICPENRALEPHEGAQVIALQWRDAARAVNGDRIIVALGDRGQEARAPLFSRLDDDSQSSGGNVKIFNVE